MEAAPERWVCNTCGRGFVSGERFCPYDSSPLHPDRPVGGDPLIGTVLGGSYTLLSKLGSGGMGVVYRARQNRLQRDVALKLLSRTVGTDRTAEERFRTEALAVSQLTNPHTVSIYDFGSTDDGQLYLVMQLIEGESLRSLLARGSLPMRTAVTVAAQVCESLAEAHDRRPQVIHRDIKPDNILVRPTPDGDVFAVVLDFGLAKLADSERLTASGMVIGTPAYMAPEQVRSDGVLDTRVDLYSLGAVLHEMVAGAPPFKAPNPTALLFKHVWEPPPPLSQVRPDLAVPPDLERLVLDLLAKNPEERPPTAGTARGRLLDIVRRLPEEAPPNVITEPRPEPAATMGIPIVPSISPAQTTGVEMLDTRAAAALPPPVVAAPADGYPTTEPTAIDEVELARQQLLRSRKWVPIAVGSVVVVAALAAAIAFSRTHDATPVEPPAKAAAPQVREPREAAAPAAAPKVAEAPAPPPAAPPTLPAPPPAPPPDHEAVTSPPERAPSRPPEHPVRRPKAPHPVSHAAEPAPEGDFPVVPE